MEEVHSDSSPSKCSKYELPRQMQEQLAPFPEVLKFIQRLQKCIEKQKRKLKKLKVIADFKKPKLRAVSTQSDLPHQVENGVEKTGSVEPKSVTEEITEAAQQAVKQNGFVYEETSGLYYDYNSGYYYNAEYGLYYDGNTGTYLKYNQESQEYEVHSQADVSSRMPTKGQPEYEKYLQRKAKQRRCKLRNKAHTRDESHDEHEGRKRKKAPHAATDAELEDGECSAQSDTSQSADENSVDLDYANRWPPCMRVIIEETTIPTVKAGSLRLITFEGGSIGREGDHAIKLPEINNSKQHARIAYDADKGAYFIVDLGSRNGTLLNGKRLAPAKVESEPAEVPHGSRLQIGSTVLLCHVHSGTQTCGHCEPGLVQISKPALMNDPEMIAKSAKCVDHKQQLKQLRKKFGLCQNDLGKVSPGAGYTDRAQVRRENVGSQNPHEKTQVASLDESIANSNKGFKMLAKMGWKEGQALGKVNQGRVEPIELVSNPGRSGMGSGQDTHIVQPLSESIATNNHKSQVWLKAQERFKQTHLATDDIFDLSDV